MSLLIKEHKFCTFVIQIKLNDGEHEESYIEVNSNSFDITHSFLEYREQAQGFRDQKRAKKKKNITKDTEGETEESSNEETPQTK